MKSLVKGVLFVVLITALIVGPVLIWAPSSTKAQNPVSALATPIGLYPGCLVCKMGSLVPIETQGGGGGWVCTNPVCNYFITGKGKSYKHINKTGY